MGENEEKESACQLCGRTDSSHKQTQGDMLRMVYLRGNHLDDLFAELRENAPGI